MMSIGEESVVMKTLTLRNVPDGVVEHIVAAAKETHQSMNAAAVQALRRYFGVEAHPRRKRDLSAFAGTWQKQDFDEFEKATEDTRKIDEELWRK
jgi:plasmid stability protein